MSDASTTTAGTGSDTPAAAPKTNDANPYRNPPGDGAETAAGGSGNLPAVSAAAPPGETRVGGPTPRQSFDQHHEANHSGRADFGKINPMLSPPRRGPLTPGENDIFRAHVDRVLDRMGTGTNLSASEQRGQVPRALPPFGPVTITEEQAETFVFVVDEDATVWSVSIEGHKSRLIQAKDQTRAAAGYFVAMGIVASEHSAVVKPAGFVPEGAPAPLPPAK